MFCVCTANVCKECDCDHCNYTVTVKGMIPNVVYIANDGLRYRKIDHILEVQTGVEWAIAHVIESELCFKPVIMRD